MYSQKDYSVRLIIKYTIRAATANKAVDKAEAIAEKVLTLLPVEVDDYANEVNEES